MSRCSKLSTYFFRRVKDDGSFLMTAVELCHSRESVLAS